VNHREIEEKLAELEEKVRVVAGVVASTTDDVLRANFMFKELEENGYLPELPWELVTKRVDLQYNILNRDSGDKTTKDGRPIGQAISDLEFEIAELRAQFVAKANAQIQR
jgi:hypothetical protein